MLVIRGKNDFTKRFKNKAYYLHSISNNLFVLTKRNLSNSSKQRCVHTHIH